MENKDKRTGWLLDLKVDDKVIVYCNNGRAVRKVEKITPTGRIVVKGTQYGSDGTEIGRGWYKAHLVEWTQEEENEIICNVRIKSMCNFLERVNWKKIDSETLEKIYELVPKTDVKEK